MSKEKSRPRQQDVMPELSIPEQQRLEYYNETKGLKGSISEREDAKRKARKHYGKVKPEGQREYRVITVLESQALGAIDLLMQIRKDILLERYESEQVTMSEENEREPLTDVIFPDTEEKQRGLVRGAVDFVIKTFNHQLDTPDIARQFVVLNKKFGLSGDGLMTYEEIGSELNISASEIGYSHASGLLRCTTYAQSTGSIEFKEVLGLIGK